MACLWKAKQKLGQSFLLSDKIRYAVAYQSILVDYGQWQSAKTLFVQWYSQIPSCSRLFRELVLVHVKGIFYQIEDLSAEVFITRIYHSNCSRRCYKEFIDPSVAIIGDLINHVKNIAHQCLAISNIQYEFESELELIVDVCTIYSLTIKQMDYDARDIYAWADRLTHLWQKMQWESPGHTVRHLKPFVKQLPYASNASYYWTLNIDTINVECRERLSKSTHVVTSRLLADCLFSIGLCMMHHSSYDEINIRVLNESLEEYERCTNRRHYRIPLLKRLVDVLKESHAYSLTMDLFSSIHPKVPENEKTAIGISKEAIHQFCSTLDDGTANFDANTNDELFISYLKQKDNLIPVWMFVGQQTFQFAPDI